MDERLVQFDEKMQKTMNNLSEEFGSIRAGRANPHVLDKLRVDYYGTPTPIQQVANVNVPEPRMIQIQPWEASMVKEIEKVIMTSDLGINPTNDGKTIRLLFCQFIYTVKISFVLTSTASSTAAIYLSVIF